MGRITWQGRRVIIYFFMLQVLLLLLNETNLWIGLKHDVHSFLEN